MLPAFALFLGCAHQGPVDVLDKFLTAEQRGEYDQSWRWLSTSDQGARTIDAFALDHYEAGLAWVVASRQTTTKLIDAAEGPDRTTVRVQTTHPDVALVAASMAHLPTPPDALQFEAAVAQLLPGVGARQFATVEEELSWTLVREDRGWRVWLGIAQQDEVVQLQAAALRARQANDAPAEINALRALLKVAPDPSGAVQHLQTQARERLSALGAPP